MDIVQKSTVNNNESEKLLDTIAENLATEMNPVHECFLRQPIVRLERLTEDDIAKYINKCTRKGEKCSNNVPDSTAKSKKSSKTIPKKNLFDIKPMDVNHVKKNSTNGGHQYFLVKNSSNVVGLAPLKVHGVAKLSEANPSSETAKTKKVENGPKAVGRSTSTETVDRLLSTESATSTAKPSCSTATEKRKKIVLKKSAESTVSYAKLMSIAANMNNMKDVKVSKDFWEKPKSNGDGIASVKPSSSTESTVSTSETLIPGLDSSITTASSTSTTTTITTEAESTTITVEITSTDVGATPTIATANLSNFKIRKLDPKEKSMNNNVRGGHTSKIKPDTYASPLDKILAESSKFAKVGKPRKQQQRPPKEIERNVNVVAEQNSEEVDRRRVEIERSRRQFEENVQREQNLAKLEKDMDRPLRNLSLSPPSYLSPSAASATSSGGRSSAALTVKQQQTPSDLYSRKIPSLKPMPFIVDSDNRRCESSFNIEFDRNRKFNNIAFESLNTLNESVPHLIGDPPPFIWDGTSNEGPSNRSDDAIESEYSNFITECSSWSTTNRKPLLKPPLLSTTPPPMSTLKGPRTPPSPSVLLKSPSKDGQHQRRVLLPQASEILQALLLDHKSQQQQQQARAPIASRPCLLGTPSLLDFIGAGLSNNPSTSRNPSILDLIKSNSATASSSSKKSSLLRTPLLPFLPNSVEEQQPNANELSTDDLLSMINPKLLGNNGQSTTSKNKSTLNTDFLLSMINHTKFIGKQAPDIDGRGGNLTVNDARSYLMAASSVGDEEEEPAPKVAKLDDNLIELIEEVSKDDSIVQVVLLDVFRELKADEERGDKTPANLNDSTDSASNDVAQLKGVFITLLNEPTSILQTDLDLRRKTEELMPVLDEMESLGSKHPAFLQVDMLSPLMQFAKEIIALSDKQKQY